MVTLVHRSEALTARHDIVEQVRHESRIEELPGWELESLDGGDRLEGVTIVRHADGERRQLEAGGLVVKIARVPRTDLFRGQLELDRAGAIVVDGRPADVARRRVCRGRRRLGFVSARRYRVGPRFARRAIGAPIRTRRQLMTAPPMDLPAVIDVIAEFRRSLGESAPPPRSRDPRTAARAPSQQRRAVEPRGRGTRATTRMTAQSPPPSETSTRSTRSDTSSSRRSTQRLAVGIEQAAVGTPDDGESRDGVRPLVGARDPHLVHGRRRELATADRDIYAARLPLLARATCASCKRRWRRCFDDVRTGRKRFVPYQSLKLYGSDAP